VDDLAEAGTRVESRTVRGPRLFYGWWVVTAGAAIQFLSSALLGQAYGTYVVLLARDLGWSKTVLSAASSLREAESGIVSPIQGVLLDKLGPRNVTRAGVVILGLGFMAFSQVNTILTFYLAFVVMSVGTSLCGYTSITFAAVHWFDRKRATAISLTSAGFAIGGMAVPLTVLSLENLGWRETAFLSGIIVIAAGLPLAQFIHTDLEKMGLRPDGDPPEVGEDGKIRAHHHDGTADFTLREAMRTYAFWWVAGGHASALFIVAALNVHLVSHLNESLSYSLGQAAAIVFLMTVVQFGGTLTGGPIGDRFSKRWLAVVCMGMHVMAIVLLAHATGIVMVVAFALLHGLAWGWRGPQMAAIRADYFGRAAFGKILGVSNLLIIVGTIAGPLIAGYMYDRTGNYVLGFDILAAMAAAGSIFFVLARRPDPPARLRARMAELRI
jgi:sugar phosphate permease